MRFVKTTLIIAKPGDDDNDQDLQDYFAHLQEAAELEEFPTVIVFSQPKFQTTIEPCDTGIEMTPWSLEDPPEPYVANPAQAKVWKDTVRAWMKEVLDES